MWVCVVFAHCVCVCVCVCVFAMSTVSCIVGMNVRSGLCKLAIMLRIVHSKFYKDFLQIFLKRRVMCKDHVYNYIKSTGYKKLTDFMLKFFAVVFEVKSMVFYGAIVSSTVITMCLLKPVHGILNVSCFSKE